MELFCRSHLHHRVYKSQHTLLIYSSFLCQVKVSALWVVGIVFAVTSILGAGLTLLVPETMGRKLPSSVEEIESWPLMPSKEDRGRLFRGQLKHKEDICKNDESQDIGKSEDTSTALSYRSSGLGNSNLGFSIQEEKLNYICKESSI